MAKNPPANAGDSGLIPREDHRDEEMTTHSSILAWIIPRTEELGGLQSMGSQRVRHPPSSLTACSCSLPWGLAAPGEGDQTRVGSMSVSAIAQSWYDADIH